MPKHPDEMDDDEFAEYLKARKAKKTRPGVKVREFEMSREDAIRAGYLPKDDDEDEDDDSGEEGEGGKKGGKVRRGYFGAETAS